MKTYLKELTAQVRGNARLRRRLNAARYEVARLRHQNAMLINTLVNLGHRDHPAVEAAAKGLGWRKETA